MKKTKAPDELGEWREWALTQITGMRELLDTIEADVNIVHDSECMGDPDFPTSAFPGGQQGTVDMSTGEWDELEMKGHRDKIRHFMGMIERVERSYLTRAEQITKDK